MSDETTVTDFGTLLEGCRRRARRRAAHPHAHLRSAARSRVRLDRAERARRGDPRLVRSLRAHGERRPRPSHVHPARASRRRYTTIGAGWHAHLDTLVAQVGGEGGPDAYARYAAIGPRYAPLGTFPAANTVRFERDLAVPVERAWAYLTEPDSLATLARARRAGDEGRRAVSCLRCSPTATRSRRRSPGWHSLLDALTASALDIAVPPFFDVYPRVIEGYEALAGEAR